MPGNPADMEKWKKQATDWVNEHSDYIYLGKGLTNAVPADVVVAHEKLGAHRGQGINLVFGDGHVEWMQMPEAMRAIEKSKQGKAGGI